MAEKYDLAFSFAGEQRDYVEKVVRACQTRGLSVFYDRDKNNDWWGGNFIRKQRTAYSSQTRFFVPFLSSEYLNKPIPMDEFSAAMMTAVNQGDGYILPVLMPGTVVPPDLLHPHIHYLRAEDYAPEQLASEFAIKLNSAKARGQAPEEIGATVERALAVRMPKIVPDDWSKYRELDAAYEHVVQRFKDGADQLAGQRLICTIRARDNKMTARVERLGATIAGIDVRHGGDLGDDRITWSVGYRNMSDNSYNGFVIAEFDRERGTGYLNVSDFTAMTSRSNPHVDAEGLFDYLWSLLVQQIEQH